MPPKYGVKHFKDDSQTPRQLRASYLAGCEKPGFSSYTPGEVVRLKGSSAEYIVLEEILYWDDRIALTLWGGKDGATSFRDVYVEQVSARVRKPKLSFTQPA